MTDPANEPAQLLNRIDALERENKSLRASKEALQQAGEQLGQMTMRMSQLNHVSSELNVLDLDLLTKRAVERIPLLLGARFCSFFLFDPEDKRLKLKAHNHEGEIAAEIVYDEYANTVMGQAIEHRQMMFLRDIEEFEEWNGVKFARTFADKYATRSCISVPLIGGEEIRGILNLADRHDGGNFDELHDQPVVEQLAQILGLALYNLELFEEVNRQARADAMTGLFNFRAFEELLTNEISRAMRYKRPLTLLMMDVDNFKGINDNYGHQAGDLALKAMADAISTDIRTMDFAARYGGDEFTLVLPETDMPGAEVVAQRVLETVGEISIEWEGNTFGIKTSIGLAGYQPGMDFKAFVDAADGGLYKAKQAGKNQIVTVSAISKDA